MPHSLTIEYGLTAEEILDAIDKRFRAKVTLEGAVAEVHLGKVIKRLFEKKLISSFEEHDIDGYPDYTVCVNGEKKQQFRIECKNIRNSNEAYKKNKKIIAYKVETQKTRTSKGDASSRYYDVNQFEILAVCLGKKTHRWDQFLFILTKNLSKHNLFPRKLAVMHAVPLPEGGIITPWYDSLELLIKDICLE